LTQEQIERIEVFRQGMESLRRKMTSAKGGNARDANNGHSNEVSEKPVDETMGSAYEEPAKPKPKTLNLLTVLSDVKKAVDDAKANEKVQLYRRVLEEDISSKVQAKAKKKGARKRRASRSGSTINASIDSASALTLDSFAPSDEGKNADNQGPDANQQHIKQLAEELNQSHLFRNANLIAAENALIFQEFYDRIWQKLSIIGLSIYLLRACG